MNEKGNDFSIPVLFIIYKRADTAAQVFDKIRSRCPTSLYVAANGPKDESEVELCNSTRELIKKIDWECNVHLLFRDEHLDLKNSVSSAIDWFFQENEMGIILEDDCVPDLSFFDYCEKLLGYYKNDSRVMMICGTNYLFNRYLMEDSFFFSVYYPIWGWATWKRAWGKYDIDMKEWPNIKERGDLSLFLPNKKMIQYFTNIFDQTYHGYINTWDIQWVYSCIKEHGLAICPKYNLISNVGMVGTHADGVSDPFLFMPTQQFDVSRIIIPKVVLPNLKINSYAFDIIIKKSIRLKCKDIAYRILKQMGIKE